MKKTIIPNSLDRIYAFIIDYILFAMINITLFMLCLSILGGPTIFSQFPNSGLIFYIFYSLPWMFIPGVLSLNLVSICTLFSYFLSFSITYFYFDSKKWGTPGKKNKGIMLCNLDNSNLSLLKAFARNFIKFFFFVCCPFLLLPFWGGGTQGLHDKICSTKVVTAPPPTSYKIQKMPHGFKNAQKKFNSTKIK